MSDDLPPGYSVVVPAPAAALPPRPLRVPAPAASDLPPGYGVVSAPTLTPTGQLHDGDTFRLSNGQNARLYGADAYELRQTGRTSSGAVVPLGINARDFTKPYLTPSAKLGLTGAQTYGRPVASVTSGGKDLSRDLIGSGNAWATPEYLKNDPTRLHDYMEAERQARMNFRGGFGTDAQKPSDFRHNGPPGVDPWAKPEALPTSVKGGDVVWWDQPTPFQGLRPEIERGYTSIFKDMKSTPEQLMAYAQANGFKVDPAKVQAAYAHRAKDGNPTGEVSYEAPPRVLTDLGDGTLGATIRGVADPLNVLDEAGGLVDSLLPNAARTSGQERENVWNSNRRFGDILANNTEQNRQILGNDAAEHGWARFGGQMAGGLIVPGASVDGVGLAAARQALRSGATRFAANRAATRAVATRLGAVGAGFSGAAGFGAGETLPERFQNAAIAAPVGGALGFATPYAVNGAAGLVRRALGRDIGVAGIPATMGDTGAPATPSGGRLVDMLDLNQAPATARAVSRLDIAPSRPADIAPSSGGSVQMPAPRPLLPPRSLDDVAPDVEAWAKSQGWTPHDGQSLPPTMLHGSPYGGITEFDPYGKSGYGLFGTGTYMTDNPAIAASYTTKGLKRLGNDADQSIYAVRHTVTNPLDMDAPAGAGKWEAAANRVLGDAGGDGGYFDHLPKGATNEQFWREVEDHLANEQVYKSDGQEAMDAIVRSLGHDGITHIGGGRAGDGPRHRVVIALDPEQTQVASRVSVRDLLQPPAPRTPDVIDASGYAGGNPVYSPAALRAGDASGSRPQALRSAANSAEHGNPALVGFDMSGPEAGSVPEGYHAVGQQVDAAIPAGYRIVDRIDVNTRPRPMLDDVTEAQRRAQSQRLNPSDVLPLPDSAVASMEEAEAIGAGMRPTLKAPNEDKALGSRTFSSPNDGTKTINKRGPLDLVTWLRTQGGVKPQGGELEHYGIDNKPRSLDFAAGENRLGKLVDQYGMPYDEAAARAHEAGFFPDHVDRPTVDEFLDALHATHTGRVRSFRPDDFAEVDQFHAERDARHSIEAARERGAPMAADRSGPVDMADLDRNAPPVHAYEEWGDQAPDFAGNLRLGKLDSPQSIKRALTVTEQRVGGFDAATRGRVTHAETEMLACDLGMTPADLLARRKGEAFNAEQALAARQILAKSANELVNMAKRVSAVDNPGDEAMAAFREAWTRHVAIQEQVAGATAEAGRALQQFRMDATSRAVKGEVLRSLAEGPFGPRRLKDVADRIVDMEGQGVPPGAVNRFAADAIKPKFMDKLVELYYNSILSGPQTHVVNVVSNTITALSQLPEHALAAAIGAPRAAAASAADRVLFSELGARGFGLLQGTKEGLREAGRTLLSGHVRDLASKVEAQETNAISGFKGAVIRSPTRLLSAEDELFKGMARRMELGGLAVRQANAEGLKGEAARSRIADLIANPTDDLLAKSFDYGRYLTFQRPLPQGSFSQGVSAATQRLPLSKLILPFVRTPVNILKFAGERSPVAPLLKEWRTDFLAGGARRDLAIAKTAVGTGIMAGAMEMAANGSITGGGPADRDVAATMRADGWQPYSVKIGGKYYAYSRLDPYSTTVGIAADFADMQSHMTQTERDDVAGLLVASTIKNLADKTWFSGVVDMAQAISDPQRYGASYLRTRVASIAVPSVIAQTARTLDPGQKKAESILDAVRARIPGASQSVPNRQDAWGQDIVSEGGLGPDFVSPVRVSTAKNDPVNAAMIAAEAHVGVPSKKFGDRMLTPEEYRALVAASGKIAHDRIASTIALPSWASIPSADRADALHAIITDSRKQVRAGMFGAPPKKRGGVLPPGFMPMAPASDMPPGYAIVR